MFAILTVTLLAMTSFCNAGRVIDLTFQLKEGENVDWPVYPKYNFSILTRGHSAVAKGNWLEFNKFSMAEHTGTHMDAPAHFAKGHWRTQQIPPSRLVGPGVVIDVTEKVNANSEYVLTVADLKDWESQNGIIPTGAVLLMRSGWGKRYPSRERVFNTKKIDDPSTFSFPAFGGKAAQWLVDERNITALGVDTPSPDLGRGDFPVHRILLAKDIMILENVGHLEQMPLAGSMVVMGVMNIYDGSGGPMRLLALLDLECSNSGGRNLQAPPALLTLVVVFASILGVFLRDRRC